MLTWKWHHRKSWLCPVAWWRPPLIRVKVLFLPVFLPLSKDIYNKVSSVSLHLPVCSGNYNPGFLQVSISWIWQGGLFIRPHIILSPSFFLFFTCLRFHPCTCSVSTLFLYFIFCQPLCSKLASSLVSEPWTHVRLCFQAQWFSSQLRTKFRFGLTVNLCISVH